ncbi:hypothetical protein ACFIU5_08080 [Oenococcus oeni]|uniref:hypothetical protein n=1 Tax=Oenococcus oeni TaxID=1247 RepID=UPI003EE6D6E6
MVNLWWVHVIVTPSSLTNNWGYKDTGTCITWLGITDFIEVSELMKEEEKHRLSDNFYDEFGNTIESLSANIYQLNRQIVNFNNEMKNLKKEPRFAYKLKPQFQDFFESSNEPFLGFDNPLNEHPEYHTAKEWQRVDDDIKNMYKKVEEK